MVVGFDKQGFGFVAVVVVVVVVWSLRLGQLEVGYH